MDHTAIDFWLPRVQDIGIPTPRTILVPLGRGQDLYQLNEGRTPDGWSDTIADLAQAARYLYREGPIFLRGAYTAAKWAWRDSCYAPLNRLDAAVRRIVAETAVARWPAAPEWTFAVRSFITLPVDFVTATGMPIGRERRVFVDAGCVLCQHPLITEALLARTDERVLPINWRARLAALNDPQWDQYELGELARRLAESRDFCHHAWAIDFAWVTNERWVLIDMALAADAYHPSECPYGAAGAVRPYANFHG